MTANRNRYLVKSLIHASPVLGAFQGPEEVLRLRGVVERTGFGKGMCFDIPHPGATYFGANNYQAGLLAGHHLARWARTRWALR